MNQSNQEQELINFDEIEGYKHINQSVEDTNKKIQQIRDGLLFPIRTSSNKEQDKIGGYFPTDQIVIAARTGTGKTSKVLSDIRDFVNPELNPGYKGKLIVLYDTWEMPDWRNILRFYSRDAEMQVKQLIDYKNKLTNENFERIKAIGESLKGFPIYFSNFSQSVDKWYETKKKAQAKFPNHTIINVVDHTRLVTKVNERSEEELISSLMIKGMKLKNEESQINIFLSQMNRNIENSANRGELGKNTPIASDIFGADSVFQCADVVMALHRPGMYGLTQFDGLPTGIVANNPDKYDDLLIECILKQRDGWTGNLTMRHNLGINKIVDYD
jgi:replicative DNA helicase